MQDSQFDTTSAHGKEQRSRNASAPLRVKPVIVSQPLDQLTLDAFGEQFQAAGRPLWCIAAAIVGTPTLADDVLQEAAAVAIEKLRQFDPATSFLAWMSQIVRFVAMNHRRKYAQRLSNLTDPSTLDDRPTTRPEFDAQQPAVDGHGRVAPGQRAFDDTVIAALNTLDDKTRCCILLRTVLDMSYRQIAVSMQIPEGTAMSCVHRGRKALRSQLSQQQSRQNDHTPAKGANPHA